MNGTLIEFKDATLGYGARMILSQINWAIYKNDFIGMVGPNGSGKTTLLRSVLGILKPIKGECVRHEKNLNFGYVPQKEHLDTIYPFTAFEVVLMGTYANLGLFRRPGKKDADFARQCLDHVGIGHLEKTLFKNLSGGQKQRTLIARALAARPEVLILDEPTNGMDLISQKSILDLISQLHRNDKLTIIMVSHLLNEVSNYVEKIVLVENNAFQVGSVAEVLSNTNLSKLYNIPVFVEQVRGNNVIIVGEPESQFNV